MFKGHQLFLPLRVGLLVLETAARRTSWSVPGPPRTFSRKESDKRYPRTGGTHGNFLTKQGRSVTKVDDMTIITVNVELKLQPGRPVVDTPLPITYGRTVLFGFIKLFSTKY